MITAKRGDFVCVELQHVATFIDSSIGRLVTHSTECGIAWNISRDGLVKTIRTKGGYIRDVGKKRTGYVAHYVVSADKIDVGKAIEAAEGKETPLAVREAVFPLLSRPTILLR